ncbi:hypothetical protein NPIL_651611 [Nephila pilipes]|uniref:Uncharacterized protein n=1 Tax=Nephila pilipes TaxID=299642 RepID=A0A8X6IR57_NEPPI|nr:hypothetical protein NPIL_651611 [Nephila pilipes]
MAGWLVGRPIALLKQQLVAVIMLVELLLLAIAGYVITYITSSSLLVGWLVGWPRLHLPPLPPPRCRATLATSLLLSLRYDTGYYIHCCCWLLAPAGCWLLAKVIAAGYMATLLAGHYSRHCWLPLAVWRWLRCWRHVIIAAGYTTGWLAWAIGAVAAGWPRHCCCQYAITRQPRHWLPRLRPRSHGHVISPRATKNMCSWK